MSKNKKKQKIYCYVDETGQDSGANCYITVVVVSAKDQEEFRKKLIGLEKQSKVGAKKWRRSGSKEGELFLRETINEAFEYCKIYYNQYEKPIPFFFPTIEILYGAIKEFIDNKKLDYETIIYIDGIDKRKAQALTNALRSKDIFLDHIRSVRDESEPCIRLADRWAGCIRDAKEEKTDFWKKIVKKAKKLKMLKRL